MSRAFPRSRMIFALLALVAAVGVGGVWWLALREPAPDLQAKAIVERACSQLEEAGSYDAAIEERFTINGVPVHIVDSEARVDPTFDMYISGDDFHIISYTVGEGQVGEYISIGSTLYVRLKGKDWASEDFEAEPFDILINDPPCPDFTERTGFDVLGEENLDGVMTTHFDRTGHIGPVAGDSEIAAFGHVSTSQEFWVDATGQLAQFKVTEHNRYSFAEDGPPEDWVTQYVYRISGVGETNVITPPVLAAP